MTLEEIGEKFDLTRERVRQIKEKQFCVRRLKHTTRSKILKNLSRIEIYKRSDTPLFLLLNLSKNKYIDRRNYVNYQF